MITAGVENPFSMSDEDNIQVGEGDEYNCVTCGWAFSYELISEEQVSIEITNPDAQCPANQASCNLRKLVEDTCTKQSRVQ